MKTIYQVSANLLLHGVGAAFLFLAAGQTASSATIYVTTLTQKVSGIGGCSLQEAIYSANFDRAIAIDSVKDDGTDHFVSTQCLAGSGDDVIVLPSGAEPAVFQMNFIVDDAHNPFGPTATPIIFSNITIQANGARLEWTLSTVHARALAIGTASVTLPDGTVVSGTGNLAISDIHIKGFVVKGGDGTDGGGGGMGAGGAIFVQGINGSTQKNLTIDNSTFEANGAIGGNGSFGELGGGGGLSGNGGAVPEDAVGGGGGGGSRGNGGRGGGGNGAGGGGGGTVTDGVVGGSGPGGAGGELCGAVGGNSGDDGNPGVCPGGGGSGGGTLDPDANLSLGSGPGKGGKGNFGGGGGGGGFAGIALVTDLAVSDADGGQGGIGGGGGSGGRGGDGGYGAGGGASDSLLLISLDPKSGGHAGRFGGAGGNPYGGGGAALGGAIFSYGGNITIRNSTLANNFVIRGAASSAPCPNTCLVADNGQDEGGAIFSLSGSLTVLNATISGNTTTGEGGGIVIDNSDFAIPASFTLDNTIISNPSVRECYYLQNLAPVNAAGSGNLIVNNFGCPGMVSMLDPGLGPLQLNAPGNTPTMAISKASPAFNAGDANTNPLQTDQRGEPRPAMGGYDIGAFELCVTKLGVCSLSPEIALTEQLNILVSPSGGGTTTPAAGISTELQGRVALLTATPKPGYSFLNWSGNIDDPNSASAAVIMNVPQTVTANFVAGTTVLGANIVTKTGPPNLRIWGITVTDAGVVSAHYPVLSGLMLTQTGGTACTPKLLDPPFLDTVVLAPGASATANIVIDFTGCAATARFTVVATFSANGGGLVGTMTRYNQFQ